jgi:hypothetical protein
MNNKEYQFKFINGKTITVYAFNYEAAKILVQAEAIKNGWDYKNSERV